MSVHEGHRERLRNRFLEEGLDGFTEIQVLELLLFYCIPRRDTNELAHALLNRFQSLPSVLEAPPAELAKVEGIGPQAATFLSLVASASRYYQTCQLNPRKGPVILKSTSEYGEYLKQRLIGRRNETVFLLCMDAKCKVLRCLNMGEGSVNSANISIRDIVQTSLENNASIVVLAHNHPSGIAIPSSDDLYATRKTAQALDLVGITLYDHIVVADGDFVSMLDAGIYYPNRV